MKHLFLSIVLMFSSLQLHANQSNPLICLTAEELEKTLLEYQEIPFIQMVTQKPIDANYNVFENVATVIFVNPHTKSWTLVEKINNERFCVMSIGENFNVIFSFKDNI